MHIFASQFLRGLLNKIKKNSIKSNDTALYVRQVAESLSQFVQSSNEYFHSECPICFDEPKIEDAVYTPCAHMFCHRCLLYEFRQQQNRGKKKVVAVNPFKKSEVFSDQQKIEGGDCPVCHTWVTVSKLIQIRKSESGEMVSKYVEQGVKTEKEIAFRTVAIQRNAGARETLELALNGASSSKLEAVLAELDEVWKLDPGSKILLFSQYLGFLDIIRAALNKRGVICFRIDGNKTLKESVAMIDNFNN